MILLVASLAWADIPPPDAEPCGGAEMMGKPCTYQGVAGVCTEAIRYRATPNGMVEATYIACKDPKAMAPAKATDGPVVGPAAAPVAGPIPGPVAEEARCATSAAGGGLLALLAIGLLTRRRR